MQALSLCCYSTTLLLLLLSRLSGVENFAIRISRRHQWQWQSQPVREFRRLSSARTSSKNRGRQNQQPLGVGDARGEYYGESAGSYVVREFNTYEQLQEIVKLASQPLPERPDGIVTVAKYTRASTEDCRTTEAEYERLARNHPASLFLRSFAEYDNANILHGQASVSVWPTFDVFYGGIRVSRVEGTNHVEVEEIVQRYEFQNSQLDLFTEQSPLPWGSEQRMNAMQSATPRTTARFVPGYDWNTDKGFFDAAAEKAERDFLGDYESSWIPRSEDDDASDGKK